MTGSPAATVALSIGGLLGGSFLIVIFFIVDRLTKKIFVLLPDLAVTAVPNWLSFHLNINTGLAFGIGLPTTLIILASLLLIAFLVHVAFEEHRGGNRFGVLATGWILTGAISNLLDRVWLGFVVDWIDVYHRSIFNLADVWIVLGLVLLLWSHLKHERRVATG